MMLKVFVVEDSLSIRRQLVQRIEAQAGLRVVGEAGDEAQALVLIGFTRPDVVLLDLSLAQGGSGLQVLKALRREGFTGQIHVLSHQLPDAYRDACVGAGADGFFDKAEGLDELFAHLGAAPQPVLLDAAALWQRLDQAVGMAGRDGAELAVYSLQLGAGALDAAGLERFGRRLGDLLEGGDMAALTAPDRFNLVLTRLDTPDEAERFAARLLRLLEECGGNSAAARLGMAQFPWQALAAGALLSLADARAAGLLAEPRRDR